MKPIQSMWLTFLIRISLIINFYKFQENQNFIDGILNYQINDILRPLKDRITIINIGRPIICMKLQSLVANNTY